MSTLTHSGPVAIASRREWIDRAHLLMLFLLGSLSFFVLYPVVLIVLHSFNIAPMGAALHFGLGHWAEAFSTPGILDAILNTFKIVLARQAISFPLAIFIAWLLARTNVPGRDGFEFMFWLAFFLPSLSVIIGWVLLLDPQVGLLNRWLAQLPFVERGPFNIYSFWGIVWVHLMANSIDVKVMLLTPALRRMDGALEEASRMSGGSTLGTMARITVPIMTPTLVVIFVLSMIRSLSSFEIELLLGVPINFWVYSTKMVQLLRLEPPLYGQATALGSTILLFLLLMIPLQRWFSMRREFTTVTGQYRPTLIDLGRWKYLACASLLAVVFLLTVVPLAATVVASFMARFGFFHLPEPWTLAHWKMALGDSLFLKSLGNTLLMALGAGLSAPILFSLIAYVSVRTRLPGRALLDFLSWLPWAIPGMLLGLGFLWVFLGTPIFRPLYGTIFLLVIATVVGSMTTGTQILKSGLLQLGKDLEEAGRMMGGSWWSTYIKVVLPLMMPTLILVGVMSFISAARDVTTIILLATFETRTLAVLALDFISEGLREAATVMAVIIALLTTGVALAARMLGLQAGLRD